VQSERAQADEHRPARFADALSNPEFRSLYAASVLSWIGDYTARAAVTALVFQQTGSVLWSAAAFAITYAPYLLGGPLLVAIAERYPYRRVMVACDIARMLLMAAVALLELPLPIVLALLLLSALFAPPFDAARSATLPAVLTGDRYVVGVALVSATTQPVQVVGYLTGAAIATADPETAILVNAITFGISALLVRFGVSWRPGALTPDRRTHLVRETADGFRLVFGTPVLRGIILVVFCGSLFAIVPEGLGAAWAHAIDTDGDPGLAQGWIMAAVPLGAIVGALTISRLVAPATRRRLFKPLAIAAPLALVPSLLNPPAEVVAILAGVCGFAVGGFFPLANAEFVTHLPADFRARAFGVVQGGLQLLQGGAVLATGLLARYLHVSTAVGLWSLAGTVLMLLLVRTGPSAAPVMPAPRSPSDGPAPGTMDT
jgi:MFS family permease